MGKGLGYRTDFHLRFKGLKDQITEPVTINGYSNCTCGKRNHIHLVIDPDRMFVDCLFLYWDDLRRMSE